MPRQGWRFFLPIAYVHVMFTKARRPASRRRRMDRDAKMNSQRASAEMSRATSFGMAARGLRMTPRIKKGWFRMQAWLRLARTIAWPRNAAPRSVTEVAPTVPSTGSEMASQAIEKPQFAPENGMVPGASDPQDPGEVIALARSAQALVATFSWRTRRAPPPQSGPQMAPQAIEKPRIRARKWDGRGSFGPTRSVRSHYPRPKRAVACRGTLVAHNTGAAAATRLANGAASD